MDEEMLVSCLSLQMNIHTTEQEEAEFQMREVTTRKREEERRLDQRIKAQKEQEDRTNQRINLKQAELLRLNQACGDAKKQADSTPNQLKAQQTQKQQQPSTQQSLVNKQGTEANEEKAKEIAKNTQKPPVVPNATTTRKGHRFEFFEEIIFFNESLLGNVWNYPLGRAFIVLKKTYGNNDTPTYSIRDRDVNQIIDGVDQRFLSKPKEFGAWKDDYESRNPDPPREFIQDELVEYRGCSGTYKVDSMEKKVMPNETGDYVWIRRKEFYNKDFSYGEKILVKGSLLIHLDVEDAKSASAIATFQNYGYENQQPTVEIPQYERPTLDRDRQLRIHYKEASRSGVHARLGMIDEVTECCCHACTFIQYDLRMTERKGQAMQHRMLTLRTSTRPEDVIGVCTYKPILAKMHDRLEMFPEANLQAIWTYEAMGNDIKDSVGEDVGEMREAIFKEAENLKNKLKLQHEEKQED